VLETGPRGSWDERGVADPYAVRIGDHYYMYYLGQDRARRSGWAWRARATACAGRSFAQIQFSSLAWMGHSTRTDWASPLYGNRTVSMDALHGARPDENRRLGVARSMDGVTWEKLPGSFAGSARWNNKVICDPSILVEGDSIRVWFGGGDVASPDENLHGQIGVANLIQNYESRNHCYPTYGGSGIVATELGLELANRGHDVHFISYANPIRLDPHPRSLSRGGGLQLPAVQYPPYCLAWRPACGGSDR